MKVLPFLLMYLWAGLILGISFLETPLKFKAPGITTTLGVGIGKLIFNALNKIEILLFVAIILLIGFKHVLTRPTVYFIGLLLLCLLIQSTFILPVLNHRVNQLLDGYILLPSHAHLGYILIEIIKCITLIIGGYFLLKNEYNAS